MKTILKIFLNLLNITVVLIFFLIKNDKDLLIEIGFNERDINRLNLKCKKILIEQHEEYLSFVKKRRRIDN